MTLTVFFDVLKSIGVAATESSKPTVPSKAPESKTPINEALISMLQTATSASSNENGWATLAEVGSRVAKQVPEFDCRNYGFVRLSELVEATKQFELDRTAKGSKAVLIRFKGR